MAVPNQAVTFSSSGTSNTITPATGTTNSAGTLTATFASTKAESKTVTATLGSVVQTAAVTFVPGSPNTTQTTVGSSGSASPPPADPVGYLLIYVGTAQYVVPYYKAS